MDRITGRYKVGKHLIRDSGRDLSLPARPGQDRAAEAALVRSYKLVSKVERAFRPNRWQRDGVVVSGGSRYK